MIELNPTTRMMALNQALVGLPGFQGIWWSGDDVLAGVERAHVYTTPDATLEQLAAIQTVIDAHDPVWLSTDKNCIQANSMDVATVTIHAPRLNTTVSLLVAGVEVLIALTNGVGSTQIAADAPGVIEVSVKNPENRTTDTLEIEAV